MVNGRWTAWSFACLMTACTSVEWQPRPTEDTWQQASLWRSGEATIAARDEGAATEVLELQARLRDAFAAVEVDLPAPPLWLVRTPDDALLCGEPVPTIERLAAWHHAIVHPPAPGDSAPNVWRPGVQLPPEATPEMEQVMAKAVAAALPLQAPELALPASWQAVASWGILVPTDACIVAAADIVMDVGLEKADLGFGKRLLLAPFLPMLRGKVRQALRDAMVRQIVDACWTRAGGATLAAEKKAQLLAAMGVGDDGQLDRDLEGLERIEAPGGR